MLNTLSSCHHVETLCSFRYFSQFYHEKTDSQFQWLSHRTIHATNLSRVAFEQVEPDPALATGCDVLRTRERMVVVSLTAKSTRTLWWL